jgi:thiol-disulfide isomerase/thioredoxin
MKKSMSRALRIAFIPVLLSFAFVRADEGWETVDSKTGAFSLESVTGEKITDKAFEGKVVVVDFWATWCRPCVQELPELAKFAESVKNRKDVAFLSFSVDDGKEPVVKFFEGRKEKFPVYLAAALADGMKILNFPTKLIIDGRRSPARVRLRKEGLVEASELDARVAEILKKP